MTMEHHNPWIEVNPSCPLCGDDEEVYLWSSDASGRRWYCSPCDRVFPADAQAAGASCGQPVNPPSPAGPLAVFSTDTGLQPESAVSTADSVQKESTP